MPEEMERLSTSAALNCVDKAMFALHSQDESMVNHYILTIDGSVDPVKLKSALTTVLLCHPSLRSTIRAGLFRQTRETRSNYGNDILSVWDLVQPQGPTDSSRSQIGARYDSLVSDWMNRQLDPGKQLPCRVLLLRRTRTESSLVFTWHHSAADGLQFLRFIGEVVQEYNGATDNSSRSRHSLGNERGDDLVALAQACRLRVGYFYLRMIATLAHRFLFAPLSPNARICRRRSRRSAEINFCQGSLNPYELRQIRSKSRSVGATVNDILMAACFKTVEEWNSAHGKPSRKISIMVPVNIGSPMSLQVIANRVSFISVSTTHKERVDPEALLRTVKEKTSRMLRNGIAFSIVYAVYFCTHLPLRIPKYVAKFLIATEIYLDSTLLTNLGLIWPEWSTSSEGVKMGDAEITSVLGLPPVVSPMGMSLCVGTYHDHLHIALVYKAACFSKAEARTFLSLYLHELRSYQRTAEGILAPQVIQRHVREPVSTG